MARLVNSSIIFEVGTFRFNLKCLNGLTIILGESASGKTLLYKKLQSWSLVNSNNTFLFFNYTSNDVLNTIKKVRGKIILIDNADIIIPETLFNYFRQDKYNQYIIFGRDTNRYGARKENIAMLIEDNKTFYLMYPLVAKR